MKKIEILEYINTNSDYVTINKNKIEKFIKKIENKKYNYWLNTTNFSFSEYDAIIFVILCESINFCFWKNKNWNVTFHGNQYNGSEAIFYSLLKKYELNKDFIKIENLASITKKDFEKIFKENNTIPPLLKTKYKTFKQSVKIIYSKKNQLFDELFACKSDEELLNYIVSTFSHFNDISSFKGVKIAFNKRATLLVNDLYRVSNTIRNNIKNINNLTGGADYALPMIFFNYGIFEYNRKLKNKIVKEKHIKHNSQMEIEIRANTLYTNGLDFYKQLRLLVGEIS